MTSTRRLLALMAALALLGAAYVPASSLAQDDDSDADDEDPRDDEAEEAEQEDEQEREDEDDEEEDDRDEKREVKIETEGNDAKIELERETEPSEDKVEMKWNAEEATFELEYETENETREIENELKAVFGALAEYRDEDGNDRYDPGEEIISGWALGDEFEEERDGIQDEAEWTPPIVEDIDRDGHEGKQITSTAQLGDEGNFTLRFLVFGDFVVLNDTSLSPTGAKIDIVIEDYPFQHNATDLALFLETETENEFEADIDDDEETGVAATDPVNETDARLVFTWKNTAQVEGTTHDVETTILEEEMKTERDGEESSTEHERAFVLSYPRGDEIVHDPKAEVQMGSAGTADVPGPGLAGLLATSLVAFAIARTRFRNG